MMFQRAGHETGIPIDVTGRAVEARREPVARRAYVPPKDRISDVKGPDRGAADTGSNAELFALRRGVK